MNFVKFLLLLIVLINIVGCMSTTGKRQPIIIPAGVDSSVAVVADSLVDSLFVSPEKQIKAQKLTWQGKQVVDRSDSLWNLIHTKIDSQQVVSEYEQKRALESRRKGARKIQEAISIRSGQIDSVNKEIIRANIFNLLEESQALFESSIVANPFDEETKVWLAKVYEMMANRFQDSKKYEKAVQILKSLIRINRGEPDLYYRLGMNYWFLKRWPEAYENFKQAKNLLLAITPLGVSDVPVDSLQLIQQMALVPVDTSKLFNYIYFQADTKAKLYEADAALALLERALEIAPTDAEKNNILVYISWIKWDDGNIKASELNDYYTKLENNRNYVAAAKGFKSLLKELKTERTADQINWRISLLEFEHLEQFEAGIERLAKVIRKTLKDSIGAPVDSTYKPYFKGYGIMGYNMGIRNLADKPRVAFMYFKQSVTIDCPIRGKSYLELAKLSVNSPGEAVEMCHQALAYSQDLSIKEKSQVYRLLVEGYKRLGNVAKAKEYFLKWKLLEAKSKNVQANGEQDHG